MTPHLLAKSQMVMGQHKDLDGAHGWQQNLIRQQQNRGDDEESIGEVKRDIGHTFQNRILQGNR